jgi:NADH-quinone oxidoreductase subunit A
MEIQAGQTPFWPLAVYFAGVLLVVTLMLVASYLLGPRQTAKGTGEPYESGITPTGSARIRFDLNYYLIAMFFVIFDVETIFVFAWAVTLYDAGWVGFVEMLVFIGILLVALAYLWRQGALDWAVFQRTEKSGRRK